MTVPLTHTETPRKYSTTTNLFRFGGAVVAVMIGSGFASGQEILQFYTNYGTVSLVGGAITAIVFAVMCGALMKSGYLGRHDARLNAYEFWTGKVLGQIYHWFTFLLCFLTGVVMVSGSGATIAQYFGLPQIVGTSLIAILVLLTTYLGLHKIVNILGGIAPFTLLITSVTALIALALNAGNLGNADAAIAANPNPTVAAGNTPFSWFLAAFMYVAYNIMLTVPVMKGMAAEANSEKEAIIGGALGGFLFGLAAIVVNLALLATYAQSSQLKVPLLELARQISPILGLVFTVVLVTEVYNTAVPMIWSSANQLQAENINRKGYLIVATILTVIAFLGGQLPFDYLVNTVYPISGYFGLLLIAVIIVRWIILAARGKKA